jgi:hypothetical protein
VRQWVLSFPFPIRFLLAFDPALCSVVRTIFVCAILASLEQRATRAGTPGGRSGAVVLAQRFDGALNLNLPFHALVLDCVYTSTGLLTPPRFHPAPPLTDDEVVRLAALLCRRIVRHLQRRGRLPRAEDTARDEADPDEPLFAHLSAASVEGRCALGPERGAPIARLGRREKRSLFLPGALCCDQDGFSLHARVAIRAGDREGRERLCRYIARPALASERLSIADDGRVVYRLRWHWKDGTSALVFDPMTFLERLAALVPRPRAHWLTDHGVLAPAAPWRDRIVPDAGTAHDTPREVATHDATDVKCPPSGAGHHGHRFRWAELLRRVSRSTCAPAPRCGGARRLIARITQRSVIERILGPPRSTLRSAQDRERPLPPELEFAW